MLSSCRVFSSTVMSSTADFVFSIKNLVLDKLNEFSIILHYKYDPLNLYMYVLRYINYCAACIMFILGTAVEQHLLLMFFLI